MTTRGESKLSNIIQKPKLVNEILKLSGFKALYMTAKSKCVCKTAAHNMSAARDASDADVFFVLLLLPIRGST